jgi:PIN domain nuclease of toxin-antitoxin system
VRVLLDTHAALWWLSDDDRLSPTARNTIAMAGEPLLSAASLFEVSIKASLKKLQVVDDWADEALTQGFSLLPITPTHAKALRALPFVEIGGAVIRDPFDRLLVAQSTTENVPVITRDPAVHAHGVPVIW